MIRLLVIFALALSSSVIAQDSNPTPTPETDVSARSKALELAGAFSNDGYKIRDGYWSGELEPNKSKYLEVNLFAGNEYYFSAAMVSPARKIAVTVFDEDGKPVDPSNLELYDNGPVAAAGFVPDVSGRYFVKITLLEGEKSQFCLLYSYK